MLAAAHYILKVKTIATTALGVDVARLVLNFWIASSLIHKYMLKFSIFELLDSK